MKILVEGMFIDLGKATISMEYPYGDLQETEPERIGRIQAQPALYRSALGNLFWLSYGPLSNDTANTIQENGNCLIALVLDKEEAWLRYPRYTGGPSSINVDGWSRVEKIFDFDEY